MFFYAKRDAEQTIHTGIQETGCRNHAEENLSSDFSPIRVFSRASKVKYSSFERPDKDIRIKGCQVRTPSALPLDSVPVPLARAKKSMKF